MNAYLSRSAHVAVLVAALSTVGLAQAPTQLSLSGLLDDYTPAVVNGAPAAWQVRGEWSLNIKGASGKADFTASLNMIRSDFWALTGGNPNSRSQHTHHISMIDGTVTYGDDGYSITGPALLTVNGSDAPVAATVTVDITGGNRLPYSNIKVTFSGGAEAHFGSAPLHGFVRVGA